MKMIIGGFMVLIGIAWVVLLGLMALLEALFGGPKANPSGFLNMTFIGGIIALIGLPLFLIGRSEGKKAAAKEKNILTSGLPARAKVTFVDKNYSVLVNQKPIYSSVEYIFEDHLGRPHIGRDDGVDSDLVIRAQIVIGSEVDVKYLKDNPEENALIIPAPQAQIG